jgi:hypothetical protein
VLDLCETLFPLSFGVVEFEAIDLLTSLPTFSMFSNVVELCWEFVFDVAPVLVSPLSILFLQVVDEFLILLSRADGSV